MSTVAIDTSRTSERLSAFQSKIHNNEPLDQTFVELPTWSKLYEKREKKAFGRQILMTLDTARNGSIKSFADTEAFDTTLPDTARVAVYPGKNYGGALVYTWEEIRETASDDVRLFDLVKHRRNNLMNSLKDLLNADLYASAPGAKDINSLPLIVSTSRSLGGIDSTTSTYWNSQESTSVGAFSSSGISAMRTMINDIMAVKAGKPELIVTTQSILESYESELDVDVRYSSGSKLDRGADELMFRGIPVKMDDDCVSGHMYFLNFKDLKVVVDPAADMSLGKVQESINSNVFVAKLVFRLQVISEQPRALGRLTGIS